MTTKEVLRAEGIGASAISDSPTLHKVEISHQSWSGTLQQSSLQKSAMSHPNRLNFKDLQFAGVRTLISPQLQKSCLIPSKCHENSIMLSANFALCSEYRLVACFNTTQTVKEIKVRQGQHHDGLDGLRGRQERWIEPEYLYKHFRHSTRMTKSEKGEGSL